MVSILIRRNSAAALIFLISICKSQVGLSEALPFIYTLQIPLTAFSDQQKILLKDYCLSKFDKENLQDCWDLLAKSQKSTFFGVTHGLMHASLGKSGNGLNLVEEVIEINGEDPSLKSARQFNLEVTWRSDAWSTLLNSDFKRRPGSGHPGEVGWGEGRSGFRGAHLLFASKDFRKGHVHIDYRPSNWAQVLLRYSIHGDSHGHFDPYNADVRAIGPQRDRSEGDILFNNLDLHQKWYGDLDVVELGP